jgi:ribosome recycling factor
MGEDCKVAIRNIRRDTNDAAKAMKKNSEITEDDLKSAEKNIQDVTDKLIKEVDVLVARKDKEIMEI